MWDCIKSEGLHLGTCSDRFLFGSCCYHNTTFNDIDIQRPNTSTTTSTTINNVNTMTNSAEIQKLSSTIPNGSLDSLSMTSSSSPAYQESPPSNLSPPSSQVSSTFPEVSTLTFLQSTSSLSNHQAPHKYPPSNTSASTTSSETNLSWQDQISGEKSKPSQDQIEDGSVSVTISDGGKPLRPTMSPHLEDVTFSKPTISTTISSVDNDAVNVSFSPNYAHESTVTTVNKPSYLPHQPTNYSSNQPSETIQNQHQQYQVNSQNPQQQTRPGSWLSRPASLLANAFFHSFKPFPYLNANRQRPTYRPITNGVYRPTNQYRPNLRPQSASISNVNSQQVIQIQNASDTMMSNSSETSFTSLQSSTSASNNQQVNNTSFSQDNNDHHIVNPASSMTNRHRPMDKNQYSNGVSIVHKQNHYDLVNSNSSLSPSITSNLDNHENNLNNSGHLSSSYPQSFAENFGSSSVVALNTLDHHISTLEESGSNQGNVSSSSSFQSTDRPITIDNIQDQNNQALNNGSPFNIEYSKPSVIIEQPQDNHTINYSSYPIITSYQTPILIQQPSTISRPHFSTLGPIDEIHGLSNIQPSSPTPNITASPQSSSQSTLVYENSQNHMDQNEPPQSSSQEDSIVTGPYPDSTSPTIGSLGSSELVQSNASGTIDASSVLTIPNRDSIVTPTLPSKPTRITPSIASLTEGNRRPSGVNKEVACGVAAVYPQTKVVGGKNAAFGAWPWQVSVRKVSFFGFSSTHRCGGAVISSEWIATAGHCVEDLALQSIRIRVGEYDFSSVSEPYPYIERAARRKVVHPKYNFYTYENDLALVQLDQPIQFPPHVAPICLPPDNIDLLGRNATVTGWGRLNEGGTLPTILQEVRVPIVSNDKCKDMFLSAGRPEYIPDIFLCAGYEEGGRDSCQGDSGGPLQVKGDDGKWFLAGIISWGIGCAEQNLPGVCTRISRFKLWIQSTMSSSA